MKEKEIIEGIRRLQECSMKKNKNSDIDIYITLESEDTSKKFIINCNTYMVWKIK